MNSGAAHRRHRSAGVIVAAVALFAMTLTSACGSTSGTSNAATVVSSGTAEMVSMTMTSPRSGRQAALYTAMRSLWAQHMEWTYATVSAFVDGSPSLQPTLRRLLRNQADIGDAVKPFYGAKAGDRLTALLKQHINDAVPVLVAAKEGDSVALGKAVKAWYANAKRIGDFLAAANPHWGRKAMERMMKEHITQTIGYASDQLQGHYAKSIRDYGVAEAHMMRMADMLSHGLILQFPRRF